MNPFLSSSGDPCVKCERNADQLALQHHPIETGRQSQSGPLVQRQAGEATIQVSDIFLTTYLIRVTLNIESDTLTKMYDTSSQRCVPEAVLEAPLFLLTKVHSVFGTHLSP